jgi:hypothetical protein
VAAQSDDAVIIGIGFRTEYFLVKKGSELLFLLVEFLE